MAETNRPIRIDEDDLYTPQVESYLQEREMLQRGVPEFEQRSAFVSIFYANWFYLSLAGIMGALAAWAALEPFFDDNAGDDQGGLASILMFPTVAGLVGLFLGAAEGAICRNPGRAALSAVIGLAVGFIGGLVSLIIASIIFFISTVVAVGFMKGPPPPGQLPTGLPLLIVMMGRATAWAVAAIPAGVGQGIALREGKVILNGLLGSVLGGLIGGLLFDPISIFFTGADGEADVSRAIGFAVIGGMVGLFVGLVEQWTKSAWLLMRAGPLAGKQFVLYRNPTVLGSSPKADIYLFKDEAIEPRHALIHDRGGRFEIEDCRTPDGTYVNGIPIRTHLLNNGDKIVLGKTVLEFALREIK